MARQNKLQEKILNFIRASSYRPMTAEKLTQHFSLPSEEEDRMRACLEELQIEGEVVRDKKGEWQEPHNSSLVVGRMERKARKQGSRFGFVLPISENVDEDIYVPERDLRGAMNDDIVLVKFSEGKRGGKRGPAGKVLEILKRAHHQVIGSFTPRKKGGIVTPDDPSLSCDVIIPAGCAANANKGEKVLAEITSWPDKRHPNALGAVERVVGQEGDPEVDEAAVILQFGLPTEFPSEVEKLAAEIPAFQNINDSEIQEQGRKDYREDYVVAIDPETAHDRDDALSFREDPETGNREVRVHIADVSHFVDPETALDKEARRRGLSVYLLRDFVPMLPKQCTQEALSLAENKDRCSKTVTLCYDGQANLVDTKLEKSVVRLNEELTYKGVQELLEAADKEQRETEEPLDTFGEGIDARAVAKWPDQLWDTVVGLDRLARQLRARRREVGSVDLDVPEYDVRVDEDGRVTAVSQIERDRSHDLVEEFMLEANKAVARFLQEKNLPGLYRVHEKPEEEDLEGFALFVQTVMERSIDPFDRGELQRLLEEVSGTNLSEAVNMELLRCMKRAEYSSSSAPHFALNFSTYCHFTSPIRRYPDLVVHQILNQHFQGKIGKGTSGEGQLREYWRSELDNIAAEVVRAERRADDAEREIVNIKLLRFLEERSGPEGEVFDAVITGVQEFGVFAQLQEYSIEGLIKVERLSDDYYVFQEKERALVGRRHGRKLRLGESMEVVIKGINMEMRQLDLAPANF